MWTISQRHAAVADELVKHGADVSVKSKSGFTALMFAAQQGDAQSARILLDAKADPNEVIPKSGVTPLIIASSIGFPDVVTLLLEHGAQQGEQVRAELVLAGFGYVRSHRDLAGHERVTEAQHGQI